MAVQRPYLLLLSPPCTVFSVLRNLSSHKRDPNIVRDEIRQGRAHLLFSVMLATLQHRQGRGFLFEHPLSATSWKSPELERLACLPGVIKLQVDMCAYGLRVPNTKSNDGNLGELSMKPTGLLTNLQDLALRSLSVVTKLTSMAS